MLDVAMYLEAVGKIADRIIQLSKRREELRRSDYLDFVAPIMVDLDAVHKDYLDSFRRYQVLLDDSSHRITSKHPIFDAMANDNLLSENLRERLYEPDTRLYPKSFLDKRSDLTEFWLAIVLYLDGWQSNPEAQIDAIIQMLQSRRRIITPAAATLLQARKAAIEAKWNEEDRKGGWQNIRAAAAISMLELEDLNLAEKKKRELAKLILTEDVSRLQRKYAAALKAHNQIKFSLLTSH
jgi:hypothetical protein